MTIVVSYVVRKTVALKLVLFLYFIHLKHSLLKNNISATIGDNINVTISEKDLLYQSFWQFLFPIFFMFLFSFIASFITDKDLWLLLAFLCGFVFSLIINLYIFSHKKYAISYSIIT